jgi:divalent metal cation (Fe/Co/Zn/Cd) transporter
MPTCWSEPTGHHAFVLSWISLVITLAAAIGGITAYYKLDSALILVYGLENCVDFFSSAIVLWRFYLPPSSDAAEEARLLSREKRASVAISFVLALLGFGTIIAASNDFAQGRSQEEDLYALYYISLLSIFVFGGMAMVKFRYARYLDSSSLRKDGICSALGTTLAASLFLNTVLITSTDGSFWWLDPFIALLCGLGSLAYGLKSVYKAYVRDNLPVCSYSWWMTGEKEPETEMRNVVASNGPLSPYSNGMMRDDEEII